MPRPPSHGTCTLCGVQKTKAAMSAHVKACARRHDSPGRAAVLVQLQIEGSGAPMFWIDVEVKADAPLKQLDQFLHRLWLECCGHLSAFHIDGILYSVSVDRTFGVLANERSMSARVGNTLASTGQRFAYEYDFGSTTYLAGRVVGTAPGNIGRSAVRLLARNDAPTWPCATCAEPATEICSYCVDEPAPFFCARHAPRHPCAADEPFLPVVNSPRMGTCGYTGET